MFHISKDLRCLTESVDLFLKIFSIFSSLCCHDLSTIDVDLFNKLTILKNLDVSQNQLTHFLGYFLSFPVYVAMIFQLLM